MKRFVLLCMLLIMVSIVSVSAQYNINKYHYNPGNYNYQYDDRYNPGLCGIASLAVPGLGQIVAGESKRGVGFLVSSVAAYMVFYTGSLMVANSSYYEDSYATGTYMFLGGFVAYLTLDIWATVDAVRVARVNNLAIRDLRKSSLNLQPSLSLDPFGKLDTGLMLTVSF